MKWANAPISARDWDDYPTPAAAVRPLIPWLAGVYQRWARSAIKDDPFKQVLFEQAAQIERLAARLIAQDGNNRVVVAIDIPTDDSRPAFAVLALLALGSAIAAPARKRH